MPDVRCGVAADLQSAAIEYKDLQSAQLPSLNNYTVWPVNN